MTQRDKATGRYTDTRFDKLCTCGHTLGNHTAEKVGNHQECLTDGCECECFTKVRNGGK